MLQCRGVSGFVRACAARRTGRLQRHRIQSTLLTVELGVDVRELVLCQRIDGPARLDFGETLLVGLAKSIEGGAHVVQVGTMSPRDDGMGDGLGLGNARPPWEYSVGMVCRPPVS